MSDKKDGWDKLKVIATAFGTIAIPVILGAVGWQVNLSLKERDVRLRTVELAVGILQENPKEAPETPVLREWAMDVIDAYSGVTLPAKARQELLQQPLPSLPGFHADFSGARMKFLGMMGMVETLSIPSGAEVWVDGEIWPDLTPTSIGLAPGRHKIELRLGGQRKEYEVESVIGAVISLQADFTE